MTLTKLFHTDLSRYPSGKVVKGSKYMDERGLSVLAMFENFEQDGCQPARLELVVEEGKE
jgi:hypothetical protein